ncbi:MAG: ribonuclease J [Bacilli bacterium]
MNENVKIYALGGLDSNGNNLYCVDINGDIFVICCGAGYPDKTTPGIDFIIPNYSFLKDNKTRVKGYIITDAHDDTFGALPFIYREIPAPVFTTHFIGIFFDLYSKSIGINQTYDIKEIDLSEQIEIAAHKISFFRNCHSSPDSFGVVLDTPYGNVVYSGDFIFEYCTNKHFQLDLNTITQIGKKKTLALLCDSINAGRKGFTSPNHRIKDIISKDIIDAEGKVFVGLYNQHFFNYIEIIDLVISLTTRQICFYDKESETLFKMLSLSGIVNIPSNRVLPADDLPRTPDKNVVIIISGIGDKLYNKISLLAVKDVDDKRFSIKETDTFILACPPAPNFEVLAVDVLDELYRNNCKVVNVSRKQLVKMHASEDDIKMLVSLITPKYFIPVKGEYRDLMSNASLAINMNIGLNHSNVLLLDNGDVIEFFEANKPPKFSTLCDIAEIGTMMVDGSGVGDVANEIILERTRLSTDGVVVLSVVVSASLKKIIGGPDVQMRGYLFVKDSEQIIKGVTSILENTIAKFLAKPERFNKQLCEKEIVDECTRYTRRMTKRNPIIDPSIIVLD